MSISLLRSPVPGPQPLPSGTVVLYRDNNWQSGPYRFDVSSCSSGTIQSIVKTALQDQATYAAYNLPVGMVVTLMEHFASRATSIGDLRGFGRCVDLVGTGQTQGVDLIAVNMNDCVSAYFWRTVNLDTGAVELFEHENFNGNRNVIFLSEWKNNVINPMTGWWLEDKVSSIKWSTLRKENSVTFFANANASGPSYNISGGSNTSSNSIGAGLNDTISAFRWGLRDTRLVNRFLPSVYGFTFKNTSWPHVPDKVIKTPFGDIKLGDAANGLCGGMVFAVRDLYENQRLPISSPTPPPADSTAFNYVVDRLFDSFNIPAGVTKLYDWMVRSRHDVTPIITLRGLSWMTIMDAMPKVRAFIDSGHPCPLCLITPNGWSKNIGDIGKNHVVLAYGYDVNGNTTTVRIYDPNEGKRDDITITFNTSSPDHTTDFIHSTRGVLYGFYEMDWYRVRNPAPVANPSS